MVKDDTRHLSMRLLEIGIGTGVLALLLHTFVLMGIVSPLYVSAGSMAPHLLGPHWKLDCPGCGASYEIGADAPPQAGRTQCPECARLVLIAQGEQRGGARIHVDRATFVFRTPRRWEPIVFRCPHDARRLCVKRVLGMPGERIQFDGGDLFVDGELEPKALSEQIALRVLVHRERAAARRWRTSARDSGWMWQEGTWRLEATGGTKPSDWLEFAPPGNRPVTDRLPYNAGVRVVENRAPDLMLTFRMIASGTGKLWIEIGSLASGRGHAGQFVVISLAEKMASLTGRPPPQEPAAAREQEPTASMNILISLFDRQLLVAIDGRPVVHRTLSRPARPSRRPFAIGARGLNIELRDLGVWRDVAYTDRPGGPLSDQSGPAEWRLGDNEYFVVGDNPAISDDSRTWPQGPRLRAELIVGRPLGLR